MSDININKHEKGYTIEWSTEKEVTRKRYAKNGSPLPDETYTGYDRHSEAYESVDSVVRRVKALLS